MHGSCRRVFVLASKVDNIINCQQRDWTDEAAKGQLKGFIYLEDACFPVRLFRRLSPFSTTQQRTAQQVASLVLLLPAVLFLYACDYLTGRITNKILVQISIWVGAGGVVVL